ncbi:MAG: DNA polymerase I [Anaerolineae bacterium]|nr:DNA polymerase I [Anaerolineae bacterium]
MSKTLMLIDGHALAYRAYHAIPPLSGPSGEPTNATFGYANILLKAIDDHQPDYVVATFDAGRTFRHEEYEEYKATRLETPGDLRPQFGRIQQLTETLGIPIFMVEGYEADDLLGTLARQASEQGLETIIVTGDSDTFQLITPQVTVLSPRGRIGDVQLYDEKAIQERYGLKPEQLVDLKALTGDSSDNIPGVRGVGIKTATQLLQEYGTLEGIYAHLPEISSTRFRKALEEGRESAELSRHLVEIVRDVDIQLDVERGKWGAFDRDAVMDLLRELGFGTLVSRIPGRPPADGEQLGLFGDLPEAAQGPMPSADLGSYQVVNTREALKRLVASLAKSKRLALDTETTSTDPMQTKLVGISLSATAGEAYYIPVGHDPRLSREPQLPVDLVRELLGPVLADEGLTKVMHNAKFDLLVLDQHDLPVRGPLEDTMLAAWLLAPSGRGIGLKEQAWQRLGVEMTEITELIGSGRNQTTMDKVSIARAAPYACADADMTLRLLHVLLPELEEQHLTKLFAELEMPLVPVLASMEKHGMAVDADYLARMSREMSAQLEQLSQEIFKQAGHSLNINSPKQLGVVLFEELGLPVQRRTSTGYSTASDVLEALKDEHPIIGLIEQYRQIDKIRGTYVDALPALINPRTGRVHTSFNQTGASTGRLSSSDPNLQNIPIRSEIGREVRGAFVAPAGHLLLGCDYSQVELRLLAHLSKDPEMLGAFDRDEDVHATTAAAIFGVALNEVSYEQRSLAKAINFGLMYGMSEFGLAARTDLDAEQARAFIAAYFGRFSRVKEYLEETIAFAHKHGYVETVMGRRRLFPELKNAPRSQAARAAERAAVNMPIQGSAADIIKLAMIELHEHLAEGGLAAQLVLQVHDELVLEVPEEELSETRELVVGIMSQAYKLDVPLKVDAAVGQNWMEMKSI